MRSHSLITSLALLGPATTFAASVPILHGVSPASSGLPAGWTYSGAYVDNLDPRPLDLAQYFDNTGMTGESCIAFCAARGYSVAGTEYSAECYCGLTLPSGTGDADNCDMPCTGDATEACGGPNRLTVYYDSNAVAPTTNPGVGGWTSGGCVADSETQRTLSDFQTAGADMTVANCVAACQAGGYTQAGLEVSLPNCSTPFEYLT
jgi:hypothetical protein